LEGKVRMRSEVREPAPTSRGRKSDEKPQTSDLGHQTSVILSPGQQAQLKANDLTIATNVDVDEIMAWKNGGFYFNGADIQTVMRQVARWYDVDVVYEGQVPTGHFKGKPSRDATLSQMLKMLEYTGVKYSIQGKKIIIKE
jgi:transmembrane sensor